MYNKGSPEYFLTLLQVIGQNWRIQLSAQRAQPAQQLIRLYHPHLAMVSKEY
jgi:hypothetical protein